MSIMIASRVVRITGIIVGGVLGIALLFYGYAVYRLHTARSAISRSITELTMLKSTLEEQNKTIEQTYLPAIAGYLDEKEQQQSLLEGLRLARAVSRSLPFFHLLPIPKIPSDVMKDLRVLFDKLDTALITAKSDLEKISRDIKETAPLIQTAIELQTEALAALRETSALMIIKATVASSQTS